MIRVKKKKTIGSSALMERTLLSPHTHSGPSAYEIPKVF